MPPTKKRPRIFISHAVKDKYITEAFIDFILDTGLSVDIINDVFCTSYDGIRIKTGADWRESIKTSIQNASVVFLFISPYYKESEICQNEMGAAWVLNSNTIPFMIDPVTYDTVGVLTEVKQVAKLLDEKALDEIKDKLVTDLGLLAGSISSSRWTAKKQEFLIRCKQYFAVKENQYPTPLSRDELDKLQAANQNLETTVESLSEENGQLNQMVKALKKAKNKTEVAAIEKKFKASDVFEEFESKALEVNRLFFNNNGVINGIIFNDYFDKGLTIDFQSFRSDIDKAVAANEIDGEELIVKWGNRRMKQIKQILDTFDQYVTRLNSDENFLDQFDAEYKCDFEFDNIEFWEKVFSISVTIH